MKLRNPRATIKQRTLSFLYEAHATIVGKGDDEPRMTYMAMSHYLTAPSVIGAAVRLGYVRRYGWKWAWSTKAMPSEKMAELVVEEARRFNRDHYALNPGHYLRRA